jgi:hypothetical protein
LSGGAHSSVPPLRSGAEGNPRWSSGRTRRSARGGRYFSWNDDPVHTELYFKKYIRLNPRYGAWWRDFVRAAATRAASKQLYAELTTDDVSRAQ